MLGVILLSVVGVVLACSGAQDGETESKRRELGKLVERVGWSGACTDPACNYDMYKLITSLGYPCEQHAVTTDDGYILTIFRIPNGKKSPAGNGTKPVVFLQHGLLASSADWVINFPSESLGFLLADAGFDVWLGNMRGNTYGLGHTNHGCQYNAKDPACFWNFSYHCFLSISSLSSCAWGQWRTG